MKLLLILALFCLPAFAGHGKETVQSGEENWKVLKEILIRRDMPGEWRDIHGHSLIYLHLFCGSDQVAAKLLRSSKQLGIWKEGNTRLLNLAILEGSQAIVGVLLQKGESPDALNENEECPLNLAALDGKLEIMRMLIRHGANLECRGYQLNSPLQTSLKRGQWRAASLLIDAGVDLKLMRNSLYQSLLVFYAIEGGSHKAIDLLVDNGFDVNAKNSRGETPLIFSVENASSTYLVDTLIQHGADPCLKNDKGDSAKKIVNQLISGGKIWASQYEGIFLEKCSE